MTAEIICVGTELLLGDILNTNARFLSRELAALGIDVLHQQVVGDNAARLEETVRAALGRSDLLVFSGGLGPTADDLTKETVARCFGDEMRFEPRVLEEIRAFFTSTGRTTPANNEKQAMVPTRGGWFENPNGTAPAVWFESGGKRAVLLPGPPSELEPLWKNAVRPFLQKGQQRVLESLVLRLTGIGESHAEELLGHLFKNENPTAAVYAKTSELLIRITAAAPDEETARAMCRDYAQNFYRLAGEYIYAEGEEGLEYALVNALREKGLTLATAESCTGGLIAQRLTSVSGSSEVFGYGFVTYWEQAKAKLVGVDPAVIEKYNVVSAPVAAQMALGAAKASGADIAVSVTGVAGPTGGDEVRPVGTVYLGAARDGVAYVKKLFVSRPDRALVRARAAQAALELALRLAQGKVPAGTQALTAAQQSDDEALAALDEVFVR